MCWHDRGVGLNNFCNILTDEADRKVNLLLNFMTPLDIEFNQFQNLRKFALGNMYPQNQIDIQLFEQEVEVFNDDEIHSSSASSSTMAIETFYKSNLDQFSHFTRSAHTLSSHRIKNHCVGIKLTASQVSQQNDVRQWFLTNIFLPIIIFHPLLLPSSSLTAQRFRLSAAAPSANDRTTISLSQST